MHPRFPGIPATADGSEAVVWVETQISQGACAYYLTVADEPIRFHAEISRVDFVPLNDTNAFNIGDPLAGLVPGATWPRQRQPTSTTSTARFSTRTAFRGQRS